MRVTLVAVQMMRMWLMVSTKTSFRALTRPTEMIVSACSSYRLKSRLH